MEPMDYSQTFTVSAGQTDPWGRCRPSALLGMLQDTAAEASRSLGQDGPDLERLCGGHWILARLRWHLDRPLRRGETVTVATRYRGLQNALIYRDSLLVVQGREVGSAVTAWVVGDVVTRKMLWPDQLPEGLRKKAEAGPALKKLRVPQDLPEAYVHTARYSDIDENGHVNNARYADFCCNALSAEALGSGWVQTMELGYLNECRLGQRIVICAGEQSGQWAVRGTIDGAACFEARLELGEQG